MKVQRDSEMQQDPALNLREHMEPSSNRQFLLFCLVVTALSFASLVTLEPTKKVTFDLYVMSMSYQPEFCYKNRHEHWPGCTHPEAFWKTHLTIHGLWPEFTDGTWPQFCTHEVLDNATIAPLLPRMEQYWPNVKALQPTAKDFYEFWQHEWSKHGTCSGLNQKQYFEAALNHFLDTPDLISQNYGGVINKKDLLEAYGDHTILVCQGQHWLSEVRICVGAMSDGEPMQRVACPKAAEAEDSCLGDEIHIATFPDAQLSV